MINITVATSHAHSCEWYRTSDVNRITRQQQTELPTTSPLVAKPGIGGALQSRSEAYCPENTHRGIHPSIQACIRLCLVHHEARATSQSRMRMSCLCCLHTCLEDST